jgi:integral membrane protein
MFDNNKKLFKAFHIIGIAEALSFILLMFIAMPLKYMLDMPLMVKVLGWAHGLLFVVYLFFVIQCAVVFRWSFFQSALGFMAAVLPFGPFAYHSWIKKKTMLD